MIGLPLSAARLSLPWPGWAISTDGSFWKIAATATIGMFSRTKLSGTNEFEARLKSSTPGREQLRVVDLRPALPQRHVEAVPLVDAGGDRLVEAAVLGLGLPIGAEADRLRAAPPAQSRRQASQAQLRTNVPAMQNHRAAIHATRGMTVGRDDGAECSRGRDGVEPRRSRQIASRVYCEP